ncbi:transglutaminaseTgpA domain-containing protein [Inhella sp.]|uniref:transglutaminaseTgpA domain-containing protein n=1 Tax=Inhella sp. TaxID=1921806 RepID=UPI0035AE3E51
MKARLAFAGLPGLSQSATRETRDSFFLVGVVLLTVAPHLLRLPLWASLSTLALLGWRALLAARNAPLPRRWLLVLLLLAAVAATKLSHGLVIGREPGLTLVCLLLAMKLLELHARRDAFVVFFLGFFLVLAQYFHSQSLWVALWTLASVWGLLTALVLAQMPLGQPMLAAAAREAARSTLYGLPLMVLLYLLFPRIAPLWGLPGQSGTSGLSERMGFGDVAALALNEDVVIRLRPLPGAALPQTLYFRGPVLSRFDGRQWHAEPLPGGVGEPQGGRAARYEVIMEPVKLPLLPLLEWSVGAVGSEWSPHEGLVLRRASDLSWLARRPILERLRFEHEAYSGPDLRVGPLEWRRGLLSQLRLPQGLNPRLLAWARQLAADLPEGPGRASRMDERLHAHIRSQPFEYTLEPGRYGQTTVHAVDEFWFDRRSGFCEHYASAYVVAMRAAGVPARVVTGFMGADPLTVDDWYLVRNSHAHAWAEYWQEGRGWVRSDPTGAVAPERVQVAALLDVAPGVLRGAVNAIDPTLWRRMRQWADRADLHWQQWVLGYQRQQQFRMLESLGFESPDWHTLGRAAALSIGAVALLAWAWSRWAARDRNPWHARLARTAALLRARGLPAEPHQAPLRWAQLLAPGAARDALLELEAWRYAEASPAVARWQEAQRWRRWWRAFRRALKTADPAPS